MSAYSTINITRSKAIKTMIAKVMAASDSDLQDMMDAVLEERLYNCRIVDDSQDNDDDRIS